MTTMHTKIIGTTTTYTGTVHPYLRGYEVVIVAVHHGILLDPDNCTILRSDEAIAAAGGVDAETDLVEVAPVLEGGRTSWVTSDARVQDLEIFRQG